MIPRETYTSTEFYRAFLDEAVRIGMTKEAAIGLLGRLGLGSAGRMGRAVKAAQSGGSIAGAAGATPLARLAKLRPQTQTGKMTAFLKQPAAPRPVAKGESLVVRGNKSKIQPTAKPPAAPPNEVAGAGKSWWKKNRGRAAVVGAGGLALAGAGAGASYAMNRSPGTAVQ